MLLLRGLIIGFSIAAPVGPIGLLCIRRSLRNGWLAGFVSGMGAATADMLYGCVAAFGLKAISDLMIQGQAWLRGIGGLFLVFLGARFLLGQTSVEPEDRRAGGLLADYSTTFLLTLTNPLTIISFAAVFATLSPSNTRLSAAAAAQMVAGVFLGSSAWWMVLSTLVALLKRQVSVKINLWIGRVSGIVIMAFGITALLSLLKS